MSIELSEGVKAKFLKSPTIDGMLMEYPGEKAGALEALAAALTAYESETVKPLREELAGLKGELEADMRLMAMEWSPEKGLELQAAHPIVQVLANECANLLDEANAPNFITMSFRHKNTGKIYTLDARRTDGETPAEQIQRLKSENARLKEELEVERLRVAGLGVIAMANTPDSAKRTRITRDNPVWCASFGDVERAVDAEMKHRAEVERLRERISQVRYGLNQALIQDLRLPTPKLDEDITRARDELSDLLFPTPKED